MKRRLNTITGEWWLELRTNWTDCDIEQSLSTSPHLSRICICSVFLIPRLAHQSCLLSSFSFLKCSSITKEAASRPPTLRPSQDWGALVALNPSFYPVESLFFFTCSLLPKWLCLCLLLQPPTPLLSSFRLPFFLCPSSTTNPGCPGMIYDYE